VAIAAWQINRAWQRDPPDAALPALVREENPGIPRPTNDLNLVFQERVHAQFANGIPAADLAARLRHDGFKVTKSNLRQFPDTDVAVLRQRGFLFEKSWAISWQNDAQGRARNIDANLNEDGL